MLESTIDISRLKHFRSEADISARRLSLDIGVNEGYVRNLEAGRYENVSMSIVARLATQLGVGIDALCPSLGPFWVARQRFDEKPNCKFKLTATHRTKAYLMPDEAYQGEKAVQRLSFQAWPQKLIEAYLAKRRWKLARARTEELETVIQPIGFLAKFGNINQLTEQTILGLTDNFEKVAEFVSGVLPFDGFESVSVFDDSVIEVRVSPNCVMRSYHPPTIQDAKQAIEHSKMLVQYEMDDASKNNIYAKEFLNKQKQQSNDVRS